MRILHTSDWHLGRTLEGRDRSKEQEKFIDELCEIAAAEKVDLILLAGDVFDGANPSAAAEQLYYDGLDRLCSGGERAVVVIAGNHDNPERLKAAAPLANRYGIILSGLPGDSYYPTKGEGGKVSIRAGGVGWLRLYLPGCGEEAVLLPLPYPSEARLKESLVSSIEDEEILKQAYSKRVETLLEQRSKNFDRETVNLVMSHLFVAGGKESDSERPIHLGGALAVEPAGFPSEASYTALGHLHNPQEVKHASSLARYSGSPLAYSFSEAGRAKSVVLLEAAPGDTPPRPQEIYLSSGKPLVKWEAAAGLNQVYRWLEEGRDSNAWIDLEVHVDGAIPLRQCTELRKLHEGIVNIRPVFPDLKEAYAGREREGLPLDRLFSDFYARQKGGARPDDALIELFLELVNEADEEEYDEGKD